MRFIEMIIVIFFLVISTQIIAKENWVTVNDEIYGKYEIHEKYLPFLDEKGNVSQIKYFMKSKGKFEPGLQRGWVLLDCATQTYNIKFGDLKYPTPNKELHPDFWAYDQFIKICFNNLK